MLSQASLLLAASAPLFHLTSAWGTLGHETVAYVAQDFLNSDTVSWAQGVLGDTSTSYLANIATWADNFRYTTAGEFSAPFHFIDANDSPPSSCSVDLNRDCGSTGCVVSAIQNYTQRVQDGRLSAENTAEALQFLVHFFGDVTQPLHDEALEVGGNDIEVTFAGKSNNLHHIWDTDMLEKYRGGYSISDARDWATELTTAIKSGEYKSEASSWTSGADIDDASGSAVAWAQDANAFVCNDVLKGGESAVEKGDLDGAYYNAAVPIFSMQIAKAGYRLGFWLNEIVASGNV